MLTETTLLLYVAAIKGCGKLKVGNVRKLITKSEAIF